MLNCNKRSITFNTKTPDGKAIFEKLIAHCDVLVENFGPGVLDRQGFTWERIQALNPKHVLCLDQRFRPGRLRELQSVRDRRAGDGRLDEHHRLRRRAADQHRRANRRLRDSGIHLVAAILAALYQRTHTGRGQRVTVAMQDAVLNLARVKMRDQQRLAHGPLAEYPNEDVRGFRAAFGQRVGRQANRERRYAPHPADRTTTST